MMKKIIFFAAFLAFANSNMTAQATAKPAPQTTAKPAPQTQKISTTYDAMLRRRLSFTVPLINCEQLATVQKTESILLLDAREPSEFLVSHIAGARHVGYNFFELKNLPAVPKNTPIVVYCTVGYRSEKIGEKLITAGFTNVKNLYGSIFEWVNEGYPIVDNKEKPTDRVHAYSRAWSVWLQKGKKVY